MSGTIIQYFDEDSKKPVNVTANTPLPVSTAPAKGSVGTDELKDGAVTTPKLADGAVTADKLADGLIVPQAAKAEQAEAVSWDAVTGKPADYPPSAHTHPIAQVEDLQDALDSKLSEIADGSVTTAKVADKAVTQGKLADTLISLINNGKFTPLSGSGNDANNLTAEGIYFNNGGYGLKNAPRDNYGWILIVSRGKSNGHPQGAQLYLDKDGFDFRGYNGSTFGLWETFIIKHKVDPVDPIADPSKATVEDVATAYNNLLAALKG